MGRETGGEGRETYKLNIKTALVIKLIILIMLIIWEIKQNIQNWYWVSWSWVPGAGVPPAAARQHQTVPSWTWQQTGTGLRNAQIRIWTRIAGRTTRRVLFRRRLWMRRARSLCSPSFKLSMTCAHGILPWSLSGHLSCPPLPANVTVSDSWVSGPKRSIGDLGCYIDNYKRGPFLHFIPTVSSVQL